jgi:hypothetical protein
MKEFKYFYTIISLFYSIRRRCFVLVEHKVVRQWTVYEMLLQTMCTFPQGERNF